MHLMLGVLDNTRHNATSTLNPRSTDYRIEILLGANTVDSITVATSFDQILDKLKKIFDFKF